MHGTWNTNSLSMIHRNRIESHSKQFIECKFPYIRCVTIDIRLHRSCIQHRLWTLWILFVVSVAQRVCLLLMKVRSIHCVKQQQQQPIQTNFKPNLSKTYNFSNVIRVIWNAMFECAVRARACVCIHTSFGHSQWQSDFDSLRWLIAVLGSYEVAVVHDWRQNSFKQSNRRCTRVNARVAAMVSVNRFLTGSVRSEPLFNFACTRMRWTHKSQHHECASRIALKHLFVARIQRIRIRYEVCIHLIIHFRFALNYNLNGMSFARVCVCEPGYSLQLQHKIINMKMNNASPWTCTYTMRSMRERMIGTRVAHPKAHTPTATMLIFIFIVSSKMKMEANVGVSCLFCFVFVPIKYSIHSHRTGDPCHHIHGFDCNELQTASASTCVVYDVRWA